MRQASHCGPERLKGEVSELRRRVAARDQKLVEEAEVKPLAIARLAAHRAESEQLREAVAANCQGSVSAQRPNAHCAVRIVQLTW
ncbi:hypothetical protein ACF1A9_19535 [Streptomyces sp. NPDC014872]|uniref:hypothetical protein n=1 Tax=Streptomyces sp. NPDC014872 TaxID=3364926 RepID=UPI003702A27B